jgi:hypothetical protein
MKPNIRLLLKSIKGTVTRYFLVFDIFVHIRGGYLFEIDNA